MDGVTLWDYTDIPMKVSNEMPFDKVKEVVNLALERNTLGDSLVQQVIDWLKVKEMYILSAANFPVKDRDLYFNGFNHAWHVFGHCTIYYSYAEIQLTKHLKLPDNANGIINVLAHEILHGILPVGTQHSSVFRMAMERLNVELPVQIVVRGIHGKVERPKPKYELYCPCCNTVFQRLLRKSKTVKDPGRYYCSHCKVDLEIRTIE